MTIMFMLFGCAIALELLMHLFMKIRILRRLLAGISIALSGFAAGMMLALWPNVFTVLLVLLSVYRIFNMGRVARELMHERYLRRATRRTSLMLLAMQGVVLASWWSWNEWHTTGHTTWTAIGVLQLAAALLLLSSVNRNLKKTTWQKSQRHYSDQELPTVSVAIPARNETEDLQQCLQSVIASDYPKLEVIVLDDCSQNKRTPEIIKDFAQSGVRFIQGREPLDTWLPKNQAYERLTQEASGEYILFCGADVRFAPDSIRQLITVLLSRKKQMVSVMPRRQPQAYATMSPIQAMRYWWELVPPRRIFRRPPVLSACWIIQRTTLKKAGGFAAVARAIVPEAHFARALMSTDGYSFLRASRMAGIQSSKRVEDQRDTAVRMRYPQVHRRPEQVFLVSFLELFFFLMPFVLAIIGFWVSVGVLAQLAATIASVVLLVIYAHVVWATRTGSRLLSFIGLPVSVFMDVALLHYSMWRYEFSTVEWKGRNICVPAMHVVPHLPKI